ncbi:MAG: DEAD/DEAH box helicase family protein [Bacteroidota bacterium]
MSSYFEEQSSKLSLPLAEVDGVGLRSAQRAAIYSVAAHFARNEEPALVAMPTGSGKTAILMLAAFVLRAKRVLVLTPSVLVRSQIADRFGSLSTLRKIKVVTEAIEEGPASTEVTGKLKDEDAWEALREFDVVVGIPNSLSPAASGVWSPPPDLFDLILVDEAHHGRARTWEALIEAFPSARQVHFTATPFRRDRRELKGLFVYTYSLSEAYEDGVFGEIVFQPVEPEGENADVAIAKAAEAVLLRDRSDGYSHLLMVRTDSRKRANELKDIYAEHTDLDLRLIHSRLAPRTVKRSIERLRTGELDGVICVDMLGEGFDLPELKVAAVHAPHKSLAVTLQFIGRFARTESDDPIGQATFIAVPSHIEVERQRLYEESDAWQLMVANLSEGRIGREVEAREQLATFERVEDVSPDLRGVSPGAFRPLKHVKVYRVTRPASEIDITVPVEMPSPFEVVDRWDTALRGRTDPVACMA